MIAPRPPIRRVERFVLPELDETVLPARRLSHRAAALILCIGGTLGIVLAIVATTVDINRTVDGRGVLEPLTIWPVRARLSGTITDVLVHTGDTVHRGQALAVFDSVTARAELAEARAAFGAALLDSVRLAASQPAASQERAELVAQAQSKLARARAVLLERMVTYGMGKNVDSMVGAYTFGRHVMLDEGVADVRVAESEVRRVMTTQPTVALDQLERERRAYDLARLRAEVEVARAHRDRLTIVAPVDGIVLTPQLEHLTGAVAREGDQLMEVADLTRWRAVLMLNERAVHDVRVGNPVSLTVGAISPLDGNRLRGRVAELAEEPDSRQNGLYQAIVALESSPLTEGGVDPFRRGYGVEARIVTHRGTLVRLFIESMLDKARGRAR